ncbi:cell wall biosynthesis glycosyltransferase-like protein [Alkalidesulfovibrio alkalitolerans DSM 16529]|uniref:Cell wall biosynthesis glycosyltransferase-like protein n=1 Tax=Alkalidesulfovibrio alkalitolerans DSM 16529 TaxID=1121439 RepID=S7UE98_9BACT|nr:glycosyltransferase family 2 protein [Alkalidesulfovibrio alkalitolerans]EPR30558.1 cell wall biosynthesis glycosyltransferase-like protein [Alkalidesulfovibrio alkalitolerans DSM 16529]
MMAALLFPPLAFLSLAAIYLFVAGLASRRPVSTRAGLPDSRLRFAVVVPAHDEENTIAATLQSLATLNYPKPLHEVVVIADNCSDGTAGVARSMGARCIERVDPTRRGKGQALRHAFDILLAEDFQAVAVVDADTLVAPGFLDAMNERLASGDTVVQARYGVVNPDGTPLTYVLAVGNAIENDLFLHGRENLGLASILRGNGMCFAAEVLREHPWEASSVVEDTEYSLDLLRRGVRTRFAPETEVRAPLPLSLDQAAAQRVRWASGNSRLTRLAAFSLIAEGLKSGRLGLADIGFCLLVRSKPLLLLLSFVLAGIALLLKVFAAWAVLLAAFFTLYMAGGMVAMGLSRPRARLALAAPFYLFWLMAVSLLGLTGFRSGVWARTRRA